MLDNWDRPNEEKLAASTAESLTLAQRIFAARHTSHEIAVGTTGYTFVGELERQRLALQNLRGEWPTGHKNFLRKLQAAGYNIGTVRNI